MDPITARRTWAVRMLFRGFVPADVLLAGLEGQAQGRAAVRRRPETPTRRPGGCALKGPRGGEVARRGALRSSAGTPNRSRGADRDVRARIPPAAEEGQRQQVGRDRETPPRRGRRSIVRARSRTDRTAGARVLERGRRSRPAAERWKSRGRSSDPTARCRAARRRYRATSRVCGWQSESARKCAARRRPPP